MNKKMTLFLAFSIMLLFSFTAKNPLVSKFTFISSLSGGEKNPQLLYSNINEIGIDKNGTGIVLTPGIYNIELTGYLHTFNQPSTKQYAFFKFGLENTINSISKNETKITLFVENDSSLPKHIEIFSSKSNDTIKITKNTTFYITTYVNRNYEAEIWGDIIVTKLK